MTKTIARKRRIQKTQHCGNTTSKKRSGNLKTRNNHINKVQPVIQKIVPPDYHTFLIKIVKDTKIRPGKIIIAHIFNLEIKILKGKGEVYIYFNKVTKVPIHKQVYGGRKNGKMPIEIVLDYSIVLPKIPGKYNLKYIEISSEAKEGKLILASTIDTQWQQLVA